MEKIREFMNTKAGMQVYSFVKTYVVVLLALYLYGVDNNGKDMFDPVFIGEVAKYALLSGIRNIYKLLTE